MNDYSDDKSVSSAKLKQLEQRLEGLGSGLGLALIPNLNRSYIAYPSKYYAAQGALHKPNKSALHCRSGGARFESWGICGVWALGGKLGVWLLKGSMAGPRG